MRARPRTLGLRVDPAEARLLLQLLAKHRPTFAIPEKVDHLAQRIANTLPDDERTAALEQYHSA